VKYPIAIPAGVPDYVSDRVQACCDAALQAALAGEAIAGIERTTRMHERQELDAMRAAYDGNRPSAEAWYSWGHRTITGAWRDAETLARFRDALASDDLSHVTEGHPVMPHAYHAYRRDKGPSGCWLAASAGHDLPGVAEILKTSGRVTSAGAERGSRTK
jgi:hypothetical protein